jgi:iron complex outermembrane receptor protein
MIRYYHLFLGFFLSLVCFLLADHAFAETGSGRIEGRVVHTDGSGVGGVSVVLNETGATSITAPTGAFSFSSVPVGSYTLTLALGENTTTITNVSVTADATTNLEETVDWTAGIAESITVVSASREVERIVEAPAAITSVSEEEIEEKASHGQLPKLLEFTPGAEVTQSGVYDFNFNTRGFNSSLNRRVATLIDGRDPAVPFLGSQEWAAVSFPLDDIASLELLRGPSAALYGANASSGVLNLTTKPPRYSQGGFLRFTGGELDTVNFDFRWAEGFGGDWYGKVVAGTRNTGDFTVSRNGQAEYSRPCAPPAVTTDCLPQERVPLEREDNDDIYFFGARIDKYLTSDMMMTFEGGYADIAGPVFQTGIGRVQVIEAQRPWFRFNFGADRFNILAYYNGRKADKQLALSAGTNLALDESNFMIEGQTNWSFAENKVRLVVGASAGVEEIDSFDKNLNRQTLLFEPVDSDSQAVFGQVDWRIMDQLKFVVAARGDFSSLHEEQFSPKAALVYSVDSNNVLRFTYNRAFQVANYSEFFLQADAAAPADLSALNAFCAPFGVDCRFGITRVLALGNADLEVEKIQTWEIGYSGIIENKVFLTIDYYNSVNDNFITDLLPQLGTPLGRINPSFGPWQGPAGLPDAVEAAIRQRVPLLSNNLDGSNILAAASYTNFGKVDTQGIDIGFNYYFQEGWLASISYSWFDFEIRNSAPGLDNLLLPNSPENKFAAGLSYRQARWDAGFTFRWVDDFRWGVGPFQGDVESYATVDLTGNFLLADHWRVGTNIANLLNNEHWEAFGGDLLGRRALVSASYIW